MVVGYVTALNMDVCRILPKLVNYGTRYVSGLNMDVGRILPKLVNYEKSHLRPRKIVWLNYVSK